MSKTETPLKKLYRIVEENSTAMQADVSEIHQHLLALNALVGALCERAGLNENDIEQIISTKLETMAQGLAELEESAPVEGFPEGAIMFGGD